MNNMNFDFISNWKLHRSPSEKDNIFNWCLYVCHNAAINSYLQLKVWLIYNIPAFIVAECSKASLGDKDMDIRFILVQLIMQKYR
jgi:hypothetical protein